MREILFRGKDPDTGKWYYGNYVALDDTTFCFKEDYDMHPNNTKHYIIFDEPTDWGLPNRHMRADINPKTLGQYTCLRDKNGKRIFEGDILKYSDRITKVEFNERIATFDHSFIKYVGDGSRGFYGSPANWKYDAEVIGNIYDNPELLENNN